MQHSASHVATMVLLLSQNGLRSNLRVSIFLYKHFQGKHACPQTTLVLQANTADIHVTLLPLYILATSLISIHNSMAVTSGPADPVLAGPVFTVIFGTAHAQIMK